MSFKDITGLGEYVYIPGSGPEGRIDHTCAPPMFTVLSPETPPSGTLWRCHCQRIWRWKNHYPRYPGRAFGGWRFEEDNQPSEFYTPMSEFQEEWDRQVEEKHRGTRNTS